MKSALKNANQLIEHHPDQFRLPPADTIDAIIATAMGDIRCAINQYYFASLLGCGDVPLLPTKNPDGQISGIKRKRKNHQQSTIKSMCRDENLGLFHGLGRILNPKRIVNISDDNNNTWRLSCNVDKIVDEFSLQPRIYIDFLFENYLKYYGDFGDVNRAAEILSESQILVTQWTDRSTESLLFALWICVLGLMVCNGHTVSKWNQIVAPRKIVKT